MTDYCSTTDTGAYYTGSFTASTNPNSTQIASFISLNSSYIDEELAGLYTTPLSGTNTLNLAKKICVWLTVADIDEAKQLSVLLAGNIDRATKYREMANALLNELKSGKKVLSDATSKTSVGGFYSYNDDNDIESKLSIDDNF